MIDEALRLPTTMLRLSCPIACVAFNARVDTEILLLIRMSQDLCTRHAAASTVVKFPGRHVDSKPQQPQSRRWWPKTNRCRMSAAMALGISFLPLPMFHQCDRPMFVLRFRD